MIQYLSDYLNKVFDSIRWTLKSMKKPQTGFLRF